MMVSLKQALIPCVVFAVLAVTAWHFGGAARYQERQDAEQTLESGAEGLVEKIASALESLLSPLVLLANRWESQGGFSYQAWEEEARPLLPQLSGLEAMQWVDGQYRVREALTPETLVPEEVVLGAYVMAKGNEAAFLAAREDRRAVMLSTRGGEALLYELVIPVSPRGKFDGYLVARFSGQALFQRVVTQLKSALGFNVWDGNRRLYQRGTAAEGQPWSTRPLNVYGMAWEVRVWQLKSQRPWRRSTLIWVLGLCFAVLAALATHLLQSAWLRRARQKAKSLPSGLWGGRVSSLRHFFERAMAFRTPRSRFGATQQGRKPMESFLEDLSDYRAAKQGALRLEHKVFDLPDLCDEVARQFESQLRCRGLSLEKASWAVPRKLWGDRARIGRVLVSLWESATTYFEQGKLFFHIATFAETAESFGVRFEIQYIGPKASGLPKVGQATVVSKLVVAMGGELGARRTQGGGVLWATVRLKKGDRVKKVAVGT